MVRRRKDHEAFGCPFIDRDDPRCAGRFRLSRIEEVFGLCLGNHHACPIYRRLVRPRPRLLPITVGGRDAGAPWPTRAAG